MNAVLYTKQPDTGSPQPKTKTAPGPADSSADKGSQRPTAYSPAAGTADVSGAAASSQSRTAAAAAVHAFDLAESVAGDAVSARDDVSARDAVERGGVLDGTGPPAQAAGSRQVFFDMAVDGEVRKLSQNTDPF